MRERSCAARLGRCFLVAALALVPLAAEAADVTAMKVFGLGLGDDRSVVAETFPNMVFEPVDYADPVVGYTYEAALGRRAVERLEGRGFRPVPGRSPTEFVVRLTGDGRLYELSAWERFDHPVNCAKKIRERTRPTARRTFGCSMNKYSGSSATSASSGCSTYVAGRKDGPPGS